MRHVLIKSREKRVESREMVRKPIKSIEDFEVWQKASALFEAFMEEDLPMLKESFEGRTLAGNQLRCLDSICANMEEGYERKFGKQIKYFFRISKGSTGEARGRFKRFKGLLPPETIENRVSQLNEIRAMLASLIEKWQ